MQAADLVRLNTRTGRVLIHAVQAV